MDTDNTQGRQLAKESNIVLLLLEDQDKKHLKTIQKPKEFVLYQNVKNAGFAVVAFVYLFIPFICSTVQILLHAILSIFLFRNTKPKVGCIYQNKYKSVHKELFPMPGIHKVLVFLHQEHHFTKDHEKKGARYDPCDHV